MVLLRRVLPATPDPLRRRQGEIFSAPMCSTATLARFDFNGRSCSAPNSVSSGLLRPAPVALVPLRIGASSICPNTTAYLPPPCTHTAQSFLASVMANPSCGYVAGEAPYCCAAGYFSMTLQSSVSPLVRMSTDTSATIHRMSCGNTCTWVGPLSAHGH
jgi:hypothetical protein